MSKKDRKTKKSEEMRAESIPAQAQKQAPVQEEETDSVSEEAVYEEAAYEEEISIEETAIKAVSEETVEPEVKKIPPHKVKSREGEMAIDIYALIGMIVRLLPLIIMTGLICGMLLGLATDLFATPKYRSSTKVYVLARDVKEDEALTSGDLEAGAIISQDLRQLIRSRELANEVVSGLNIRRDGELVSPGSFLQQVSVTSSSDSRVVTISVEDEDPYVACDAANLLRELSADQIKETMDVKSVKTVENAYVSDEKEYPIVKKNALIGFVAGLVLGTMIVFFLYLREEFFLKRLKNKTLRFLYLLATIAVIVGAITSVAVFLMRDRTGPQIVVKKDKVVYTDRMTEKELVQYASAYDDVEGNVSSSLRVSDIFVSPAEKKTTVYYMAKDSHNNFSYGMKEFTYEGKEKKE